MDRILFPLKSGYGWRREDFYYGSSSNSFLEPFCFAFQVGKSDDGWIFDLSYLSIRHLCLIHFRTFLPIIFAISTTFLLNNWFFNIEPWNKILDIVFHNLLLGRKLRFLVVVEPTVNRSNLPSLNT
jgi:hypothetical protein